MNVYKVIRWLILALSLSSCSTISGMTSGGGEPGLMLVPVNHTDRYAPSIVVEDTWAGNVRAHGGGGSAACCIAGRKDWSKPALVRWEWGYQRDPVTKEIVLPDEAHSELVSFPRAPHRVTKTPLESWTREDYLADEGYLCVIFRTLDRVEFAFSSRPSECPKK